MGTDTRETKKGLVHRGLHAISAKHHRQLACDLLLPGSALPFGWLSAAEIEFLVLHPDAVLHGDAQKGGAELLCHLTELCGRLVPELVDAHVVRHSLIAEERRCLHRNGSVLVRDVLLRRCSAWPGADLAALDPAVFTAVDVALVGERSPLLQTGADQRLVVRKDGPPLDELDAEERKHKWVTSNEDVHRRDLAQSREQSRRAWSDTMRGLVNSMGAMVRFVAAFLLACWFAPGLTFREGLIVAAAATGASLLGLLSAFVPRGRLLTGRGPLAGRRRGEE